MKKRLFAIFAALCMALSLLPTVALAEGGYGENELPAGPNMSGAVINVNAANAQYVLDGAYGSIDGKTINFTESINTVLHIGRPTKYGGSNTSYYVAGFTDTVSGFQQFDTAAGLTEYKSSSGWTPYCYYSRTISNVKFTSDENVTLAGFDMSGATGHNYGPGYDFVRDKALTNGTNDGYYGHININGLTFEGLTINNTTDNYAINFYITSCAKQNELQNIAFNNCSISSSKSGAASFMNNGGTADIYKGISFNGCTLNVSNSVETNTYGVLTLGVGDLTVNGCRISGMTRAVQTQSASSDSTAQNEYGKFIVTNNTFDNVKTYVIKVAATSNITGITITGNTSTNSASGCQVRLEPAAYGGSGECVIRGNTWDSNIGYKYDWNKDAIPVARIGDTLYCTFAAAIADAHTGDTVTLLKDIEASDVIEINKNLTLDLNGKTVTNNVTGDRIFHVTGAVTFEINGTAEGSAMVIPATNTESLGFVKISDAATVTLNGGSYTGNTDNGAFIRVVAPDENTPAPDATVTLNGVTATTNTRVFYTDTADKLVLNVIGGVYTATAAVTNSNEMYSVFGIDCYDLETPFTFTDVKVTTAGGACVESSGGTATYTNCNFTVSQASDPAFAATAVAVSWEGTANILSGSYTSAGYGVYVYTSGGTINVKDGTISGGTAAACAGVSSYYGENATVNILGGDITGALQTYGSGENATATIAVKGGTFSSDPTAYVAENGTSNIVKRNGSAESYTYTVMAKSGLTSGVYMSNPNGATAANYYATDNGNGTWTVFYVAPYVPPTSTTETTTNENGSTTTVTDKTTGTVTETTTSTTTDEATGTTTQTTTETVTAKDGTTTSTETVTATDASGSTGTTTTTTNANGETTVTAEAAVSAQAITEAAKTGEAVTLLVEVPAAASTETAAEVTVSVPAFAGSVSVEIPVTNTGAGVVAVKVNPDGTEEIIKTSVPTENGVVLNVEGEATIKIVDNSKDFTDVKDTDWHDDAVAFVSAREIMNGVGGDKFDPNTALSRGMIAQVLHNFENNPETAADNLFDDVSDDAWYTDAVKWAAEQKIVEGDGSNYAPNDNITREQLAAILYRYAGAKGYDVTASGDLSAFTDGDQTASWAQEAMEWAVASGIFQGNGNSILNPKGSATRAEIAQILMNFCKNVVK